ncbi:MAG: hypothetical protein COV48_00310, partial [Elusimicrobia bacterium CG11_big_fil_rev_8_21_14_0_20_64_6]
MPGLLAAPAPALSPLSAPAPALASALPAVAAATPLSQAAAAAVQPAPRIGVKALTPQRRDAIEGASLRIDGEKFWSGAAAKDDLDESIPVLSPPAAKSRPLLSRGAVALAPALTAMPALGHWVSAAAPYAGGAGALAGAYALTRVSRWAINKMALRFNWDKNTVVLARFISSAVLWTAGAGVGLSLIGVTGTVLLATFGAGGTAMALAITLAVRDVAGNLFHGVHFLLTRPFSVGDKVTIGKTTGIVHDMTLRYLVLQDEKGGFVLYTYNKITAAAVTLYGEYQS